MSGRVTPMHPALAKMNGAIAFFIPVIAGLYSAVSCFVCATEAITTAAAADNQLTAGISLADSGRKKSIPYLSVNSICIYG